jgi:hypothetical protein
MDYYLFLVETKNEYTIHLTNTLAPIMYDGIASIYEDAHNNAPQNEELRLFQTLLKKIPAWNDHLIEEETTRIIKLSPKGNIIDDLIKAVIKSNIMVLTNTSPDKKDNLSIKHDITTTKFIHNAYIEIARNIFQNPFLFERNCNNIDIKRNQRDAIDIIKKCIEQAIRKLLPMNVILQNYLGKTFENQSDDFQNPIPDSDYNNLRHMLNKDPINNDVAYQLVKNNETFKPHLNETKINPPKKETNNINIKIMTPTRPKINNSNLTPDDVVANKILQNKTDQIIRESEKKSVLKTKNERHSPLTNKHDEPPLANKHDDSSDEKKTEIKDDDGDTSVSYYKQQGNKIIEVYDNEKQSKKSEQRGGANYNDILNGSVNLKSILDDISSIDKNINIDKKKQEKYFNKNGNL